MTTPANVSAPAPAMLSPDAPSQLGRPVWYDLVTPDPEAAIAFYTAVVGWTAELAPTGGPKPYHIFKNAKGVGVGGVVAQDQPGAPAAWMGHLATPEVDATLADAVARGATTCHAPMDIPGVGRFAVLTDPQGAVLALFSSSRGYWEPTAPGVGDVAWHELATTDVEAAMAFYASTFGWAESDRMDMGPMGPYVMFGQRGRTYGGMMRGEPPLPPHWRFYFSVEQLERAVEVAVARDARLLHGPVEVPGGDRVAIMLDPHGAPFALHVPKGR